MPSPPICSTRRSPAVRSRRTPPGTGWRNYSGSSLPPSPNREQLQMYRMLSRTFYQSPKLVCAYLLSCRTSVVPMTRTFLEEGVSDGSITVDSPQIAAEVVAVFTNLLLSPLVFSSTGPDFQRRLPVVSTMLESIRPPPDQRPGLRCFLRHGRCAVRGGTDLASIRCPLGHLILQIYIQSERMYKEVSL